MSVEATTSLAGAGSGSRPRLPFWPLAAGPTLVPILYAAVFNISFRIDENPFDGPDGLMLVALLALKPATIAALAVGVNRIGSRISLKPSMAVVAGGVWVAVGVSLVVATAWAKARGASLGVDHLWPGRSDPELVGHLQPGPGDGWRSSSVVTAEIVAVVVLSIGVAVLLRALARWPARWAVTALASVSLFSGLILYDRIMGWPVMFDFDPFVGDAILGILTYELGFLIIPVDPMGAVALAAIGVANGLILLVSGPWRSRTPLPGVPS